MDVVHARCAALDVSKRDAKVCVRLAQPDGGVQERVTTWGAMTRQIMELREHLIAQQVTRVVMEATGDYWKPFYYLLEDAGFELVLANAAQVKAMPGRKSDVSDARWLADLAAHGLVRASFVPPPPIRELRDLTRTRAALTRDRARAITRLEKLLEDAGIKISSVASQTLTVSTREMIEALIAGQRDPKVLAEMAKTRLRAKIPQLQEALIGRFNDHHAFLARTHLAMIDELDRAIDQLEERIEVMVEPFRTFLDLITTIPGISTTVAEVVLAETGGDLSVFPTPEQFCSWAGVAPGKNQSAGRTKPARARPGDRHLKAAMGIAAMAVTRANTTYLAARYRRIAVRRGPMRAMVATQRAMLTAMWHMAHTGELYHELGPDHYARRRPTYIKNRAIRQLETLGFGVTLTELPQAS
ncbi:MAG: IS110 family transposase [Nocardioides sp.]|uniref:IS110 family transposase n=1 Tax=Nocardioides sp. TaxID=35761 RepID=UPI003D6C2B7C